MRNASKWPLKEVTSDVAQMPLFIGTIEPDSGSGIHLYFFTVAENKSTRRKKVWGGPHPNLIKSSGICFWLEEDNFTHEKISRQLLRDIFSGFQRLLQLFLEELHVINVAE